MARGCGVGRRGRADGGAADAAAAVVPDGGDDADGISNDEVGAAVGDGGDGVLVSADAIVAFVVAETVDADVVADFADAIEEEVDMEDEDASNGPQRECNTSPRRRTLIPRRCRACVRRKRDHEGESSTSTSLSQPRW